MILIILACEWIVCNVCNVYIAACDMLQNIDESHCEADVLDSVLLFVFSSKTELKFFGVAVIFLIRFYHSIGAHI